ncbi:hypothetical protein N0V93_003446 [Gnomoniopsis smithogilvyi]|uniref:N-acetyltransferase domain-containing protein n=1 Tax=Gnomoniopsis smithogilvyi TaxID=1191159 RepID=A0A9W9D044_9PEZI|nr:hypothetical protein N0V93_003446 [Gnomoniopsis smithogilvyi]
MAASTEHASPGSSSSTPLPPPILTLIKVIIRPLHPSDATMMTKHANDPDISKGMRNTFPNPYSLEQAKDFLNNIGLKETHPSSSKPNAKPILKNYALCRRSDGAYMGGIGLMPMADVEARTFETGYWIGKEFWGNGYMTEALRAFTLWAFRTFPDLVRVEASVFEGNDGSVRVLKRAGFQAEGVRRKAIWKRGELLDKMYFSMLREECDGLHNYDTSDVHS